MTISTRKSLGVATCILLITLLVVGLTPSQVAEAATFSVIYGDVDGLIAAIQAANDETNNPGADIITLASNGTYTLYGAPIFDSDGANGLPSITSEITIEGNGATIARSSASGTPDFRIFHVASGGKLTLNETVIRGGSAGNGGGIFNNGTLWVINSTLAGNAANVDGGGIFSRGTATVVNSTLAENAAGDNGGGIFNVTGTMTMSHSTLANNSAVWAAGASTMWAS